MQTHSIETPEEVQSKIQNASSLVMDLLLPAIQVARICSNLNYEFCQCVYTPTVTV